MAVFSLRVGRATYWIGVAVILILSLGLGLVVPSGVAEAAAVVWLMLYGWRLHDFGRSAWWGVAALATLLLAMAAGFFGGLALYGANDPRSETCATAGMVLALLVQIGFTAWVGVVRGDDGPNRFGERTTFRVGGRTF